MNNIKEAQLNMTKQIKKLRVLSRIIEVGFNKEDAKKYVEEQYDKVVRIYGEELTIKKTAEVIVSFGCL